MNYFYLIILIVGIIAMIFQLYWFFKIDKVRKSFKLLTNFYKICIYCKKIDKKNKMIKKNNGFFHKNCLICQNQSKKNKNSKIKINKNRTK